MQILLSTALKELKPHKSEGCIPLHCCFCPDFVSKPWNKKQLSAVTSVIAKAHQTGKGKPWASSLMLGKIALQHVSWYLFLPAAFYFVFWGEKIELLTGVYFSSFAVLEQNPIWTVSIIWKLFKRNILQYSNEVVSSQHITAWYLTAFYKAVAFPLPLQCTCCIWPLT